MYFDRRSPVINDIAEDTGVYFATVGGKTLVEEVEAAKEFNNSSANECYRRDAAAA